MDHTHGHGRPSLITDKKCSLRLFPTLKLTDASKLLPTLAKFASVFSSSFSRSSSGLVAVPSFRASYRLLQASPEYMATGMCLRMRSATRSHLDLSNSFFFFFDLRLRFVDGFQKGNVLECA